jgi:predicted permease
MGSLLRHDIPYAFRMLIKNPGFTAVAVLSLGLGIGANTTIFTGVNNLLLNPISGVEDVDGVYNVWMTDEDAAASFDRAPISWLNYQDLRDQNNVFQDLVATFGPIPVTMMVDNAPQQVQMGLSTANYFDVLGVRAQMGRTFLPDEDEGLGNHPVVVLSHGMWQNQFGGDPAVVGQTITVNSNMFTVVGVTPPGFKGEFAFSQADLMWTTVSMREAVIPPNFARFFEMRRAVFVNAFGRLNDGVSVEQADQAMKAIAARLEEEYPMDNEGRSVELASLKDGALGINQHDTIVMGGTLLMGIVGVVLLIACVNLANLLLARAGTRSKELGIRVALGAGRSTILRQLLTESVLLALVGGAVGLLIAYWGTGLLWSARPAFLQNNDLGLSLDASVLAFTVGISAVTGVLFGLLPAVRASKPNVQEALKVGGRQSSAGFGRNSLKGALVIAEVALAVVTLIGAGLFLRSMNEALKIDPGFRTDNVFMFAMNLGSRGLGPEESRQFIDEAIARAEATPGVERATYSANFPIGGGFLRTVIPEEREADAERAGILAQTNIVSPQFFETLDIALVEGRLLTEFDREDVQTVGVVSEAFARTYWPDAPTAVGRRFRFINEPVGEYHEVVGVVEDVVVQQPGEDPQAIVYQPLAQNFSPFGTIQVATNSDPSSVMGMVTRDVQALDPELALTFVSTFEDQMSQALWGRRIAAGLLAIFGALALTLAAIGIYGVMSFATSQRKQEIGIRIAVGADTSQVLAMVVRQGMTITAIGMAIGLAAAVLLSRFVATLLYGVSALDPLTFGGISLLLGMVALAAIYLPARRATRIDPMIAFKAE